MTCQLDAEAGVVYNLFHANRKAETRSQGFSGTIYFLSGSFRSEERAEQFRHILQRDFTGKIDVKPKSGHGSSYTFGERGTGSFENFSVDSWHGVLATKTTRLVEASGETSPPGTYATIVVAHERTTLVLNTVTWPHRLSTKEASPDTRALFEDYLDRLAS